MSVTFLRHGFNYFSDEHPIVEQHDGNVIGKSFRNRITLTSASAKNFPALQKSFQWNSKTGKFYFNPWEQNGSLSDTCSIDKILFPKFRRSGILSIKRLKPLEFFNRLVQDDYFFADAHDDFGHQLGQNHVQLMMELAHGRTGFEINYGSDDIENLPAIIEKL